MHVRSGRAGQGHVEEGSRPGPGYGTDMLARPADVWLWAGRAYGRQRHVCSCCSLLLVGLSKMLSGNECAWKEQTVKA